MGGPHRGPRAVCGADRPQGRLQISARADGDSIDLRIEDDGKGMDPAFPPLAGSNWVTGDPARAIKLTLHGIMGPFELNGKKYDGLVPMTPFGGLLGDQEVAAVLTYVRNSFGNKAAAVQPAEVARVREATKDRKLFYQTTELLQEHPLE